jgi:hypothetical protein
VHLLFECQYDSKRTFLGLSVKGHHSHHSEAAAFAPRAAQPACTDMVGAVLNIETVSQLRPGFHEIIMKEAAGNRRVACTVSDSGSIQDWVEIN